MNETDSLCTDCGITHQAGDHGFMPMDGLALQSPTPEQIDHEILDQLSLFRQKIVDLETAKVFHMACIENLVERLKDVERTVSSLELNRLRGNG